MSNSDEDNYSDEGSGISGNASLIRRLRQQHHVDSQDLVWDEEACYQSNDYDSDHSLPCGDDQKEFQLTEQRVNKEKYIKISRHGNGREVFDSDSSGPVDTLESHDQDSRELWEKERQISSYECYENNNSLQNHNHKPRKKYWSGTMDSLEDEQVKNLSASTESLTVEVPQVDARNMAESKARRPESRMEVNHARRDASPSRRGVGMDRQNPNVIVTDVDVHVDNNAYMRKEMETDEYRQRRRKEKSDSHLNLPNRGDQEVFDSLKRSRARSEPRKAIKQGKDEVNKAEKHVHMIDFEREVKDECGTRGKMGKTQELNDGIDGNDKEMWERDGNFEYLGKGTIPDKRENQGDRNSMTEKSKQRQIDPVGRNEGKGDNTYSNRDEIKINKSDNMFNSRKAPNESQSRENNRKIPSEARHGQDSRRTPNEFQSTDNKNNKMMPNEPQNSQHNLKQKPKAYEPDAVEIVRRNDNEASNMKKGNNSDKEISQNKKCSFEDERGVKEHARNDKRGKQKPDTEPNTRYYTPQLQRRQNRNNRQPLLSLVSEDNLSNSNNISRAFDKPRNEITAFTPTGKIKIRHEFKNARGSRTPDVDFSMPRNKMGSFQDFRPMSKERSVSRISNLNDGPLSLQDSYGAGMDPNDTSQSGHRAFSSASNHFSESSSSIANQIKGGISQSPSKQSSIVRQQSVTSDINGEQREEGIKFERLKNLQEDDLFAKVKEIVGHLEKLEDYHRGDGMRVQKMLGDMYWDYTPLREMVGDCMADCGYAVVSMKMLKTLNGIGIFKNDDVWFPTYYTYNTMWNFTDASNKLAQALADNDAVRLLTLNCGHKPYINAIHSKNVYYVMKASLSILHNIARNSGMKHLFDENKTSETIMPFLESEDEMLKILATLTIANIVDEEENKTLITDTGTINCIVSWMEKALNLARRRYKGFTPQELTEGLNRLAVNDSNKMKIIEEGALPLFLKMLQHDDVREQSSAARIIWTLSFDKDVRQKINEFPELVPTLGKLTESTNKSLQTNTMGALWVIRGDNDVSKETRPKSAKSKSHVFLSYSWSDKETVLMIRDRLRAEGYAIWIDVEKMGGSTLEGMAGAVENSAVVLICMSEKYKQSPNCRTEAEYTFQLRKDYIPIMMQKKYRPDGWLGIILGAKLYFDFSGKYPFDKTFQGLLKELRGRGKVTPGHTPGDDQTDTTGTITHSHSLSSHASITGTPTHQIHSNSPVLNMGQEELIKWLRNVKLTECIPAFLEFDGKLLMQLKVMREEAPEFFYQCLEKRLNMSLIEILKFTRALEELH